VLIGSAVQSTLNNPESKFGLRFHDFAAAQARSAYANPFGRAFDPCADGAQVDVPAPAGHVMGVADDVSELRLFTADITNLGH